ncbi:glycosyltransferase [Kaistella daneshvariae]|uniref:Glycosyltransferase n=1 Tax=Kaistella daneshvariae TaxID=2487074 RepID=A0ABM7C6N5_9FLAO|nr:glycosyltransferase [Kaistella daneshvariae]AZI66622.1 glycosyltransferase [Kaistella daneshvariae]
MKILHYINNLGSGGAEKLLTDILPAMKDRGLQVELMISNSDVNVEKYGRLLDANNIKIIDLQKSFYNPLQISQIVRYVNKNKFDIVHAHLFPTQYWLSFASLFFKSKVKLVKTEHSVFNERKDYRILRPLEKFIYSQYDQLIGITAEVKSNLETWLNRKDIVTIHNGVNIEQIKEERSAIDKKEYEFISGDYFNILMVGRFDGSQKDQQTLVRSLQFLPGNFKIYFAGEGQYKAEIKKMVDLEGVADRVIFLGLRQDIYKLMHLVDLNVLSTNHEGLSGVVLESLASGQVFLGSDVVGVKEIVPDPRFLFTKGNAEQLAEKLLAIANDQDHRREMIETALDYVTRFDISYMVDNYIKVYESLQN